MRSLHTVASTHDQSWSWLCAPCVALSSTTGAWLSLCHDLSLTLLPSCLPSLFAVLLPALLAALRRCGTMKALTPAQLTYHAGLPVYLATPSCRSVSNHVGCLVIAYHHASVTSDFRTSPWNRKLVAAPRRIEFVCLRTDLSPPVAPHPASRRRSYLWLRSLWHTPTRTFTVLIWRLHGRTIPACAGMTDRVDEPGEGLRPFSFSRGVRQIMKHSVMKSFSLLPPADQRDTADDHHGADDDAQRYPFDVAQEQRGEDERK